MSPLHLCVLSSSSLHPHRTTHLHAPASQLQLVSEPGGRLGAAPQHTRRHTPFATRSSEQRQGVIYSGRGRRARCAQNFHLRSFRAPFLLCKFCTSHFCHFPTSCRVLQFLHFSVVWLQVAGTGAYTGVNRFQTLYYKLQVTGCRFCTL